MFIIIGIVSHHFNVILNKLIVKITKSYWQLMTWVALLPTMLRVWTHLKTIDIVIYFTFMLIFFLRRLPPIWAHLRLSKWKVIRALWHCSSSDASPAKHQLGHLIPRLWDATSRNSGLLSPNCGLHHPRLPKLLLLRLPRPKALPIFQHPDHRHSRTFLQQRRQRLSGQHNLRLPPKAASRGRHLQGLFPKTPGEERTEDTF